MADERYIALGNIASGVAGALSKKADQEYEEKKKNHEMITTMVQKGIESGTIKDPDAAFQFLISGGKPGKGKKKDLPPMLKTLIGSTKHLFGGDKTSEADQVAGRMASAQPQAQAQQPGQQVASATPGIHFNTAAEREQTKNDQQLALEKQRNTQITEPNAEAAHTRRMAEIAEQQKGKYGPGTLMGRVQTEIDAWKESHPGEEPDAATQAKLVDQARSAWQGAGKKETDYKSFETQWIKDATEKAGHDLSAGEHKREMLLARKAWSLQESSGDKLARAKALEKYKHDLSGTTPDVIDQLAQSVTIGDSTRRYFDISTVAGAKERNEAAQNAMKQGIIPVTAKQAEQLEAADAANSNITSFFDQVKSKLPKDAAGRPITSIENKLSTIFQTDEDLAAAVSWDVTVLPLIRAMQVSGRITNLEFQTALNSRPKVNDTVGSAAKKLANVQKILNNGANPILNRKAGPAKPPAAAASGDGKADAAKAASVKAALKKGNRTKPGPYRMSDGSTWILSASGDVSPAPAQ